MGRISEIVRPALHTALYAYAFPVFLYAQVKSPLKNEFNTIPAFIEELLKIVVQIGIPIAVFFIVYAGFLFVTARGSEEQLKKAKITLLWAIIGSAILLAALVIATAVGGTLKELTE